MKFFAWSVLLTFLISAAAYAQTKSDVCRVNTSWWSRAENLGSGNMLLGEFRSPVGDETKEKSFKHESTGFIVNVAVKDGDFEAASKGKPTEVRIALSVSSKVEDAFDIIDNAVAGTVYRVRWGSLYVEKQVAVGQLIHTFTLYCTDGNRKRK